MGNSEDLERKARFAALAANAPEDGRFPIRMLFLGSFLNRNFFGFAVKKFRGPGLGYGEG
jgi:hypothetical protein